MFSDAPTERPGATGSAARKLGFVRSVRGSDVSLDFPPNLSSNRSRATVGKFVGIRTGASYLIGIITDLTAQASSFGSGQGVSARASLDLLGEIAPDESGASRFRRGVSDYPAIGDPVELIGSDELRLVHRGSGTDMISIGTLHQDKSIPASINVNDLITKHFAVLGTTGVGKSSGVAVILQEILAVRPDLRIFLLDGHNEYGRCFGDRALVISPRTLKLPFWLFNLEEMVDVIYGGRPAVGEEVEILAELIPFAKAAYGQYKVASDRSTLRRPDQKSTGFTVDTPTPYLLQELIGLIDDRMGRLENRTSRMHYHRLITRIETIRNDPRYTFMFQNANVGGDTMGELLAQLFRLEPDGRPMCIMQFAGLPVEVTDAVVSVLCRLAFDFGLWSEGAVPLLFVCEEAHRFASADHSIGFHPTRRALSKIAKEGRKYGVYLGLVTQRPAELDATIISQCSTLFAMRLANDRDQALLRSAVSDTAANLLSFVPSLGTREFIGFGEGVPLSTRMTFRELPPDLVPRSEAFGAHATGGIVGADRDFIKAVVERWRGATMGGRPRTEDGVEHEAITHAPTQAPKLQASLDQTRYRLLKRPLDDADLSGSRDDINRLQR